MKTYKHKQTEDVAIYKENIQDYVVQNLGVIISARYIENSNDWELIKHTVEVGKVYKSKDNLLILVKEILDDYTLHVKAIGFDFQGKWSAIDDFLLHRDNFFEATTDEWLERLKIEAKKRGLVKGVKFKSAFDSSEHTLFHYRVGSFNSFIGGDKGCLMNSDNGKWATPIEEKKPILTTHDGVELFDGELKVHYIDRCSFAYYSTKLKYYKKHYFNCEVFSTKEKAKEYIENNQKRYSLNDIRNTMSLEHPSYRCDVINQLKKIK